MRKEAEAWLTIAGEELQSAEYLLDKRLFRMVCYHSQQCVEKTLKALLAEREIETPRTHNSSTLSCTALARMGKGIVFDRRVLTYTHRKGHCISARCVINGNQRWTLRPSFHLC